MSSEAGTYGPPTVPTTPSATINRMLQSRCGHAQTSIFKALVSFYICAFFCTVMKVYNLIQKRSDKPASHTMWMLSCGLVSLAIIIKAVIIYNVIMAFSFILTYFFYYSSLCVALVGIAVGVSGIVFFDKEAAKADLMTSSITSSLPGGTETGATSPFGKLD